VALDSMRQDVEYRVRDGWSTFSAEEVVIGIGLTRILPEDPFQATIFGDDEVRLICDARLDNRSELIKVLNVPMQDISDGELIFLAYRRWGQQLCHHLLGDFVIAVWNTKTRHLFLARDQVGIKPLFYRHVEGAFAFCSDAKALAGLDAPFGKASFTDIEESRILEFVAGVPPRDHVILIASLKRLPPGHTLDFETSSGPVLTRYWEPRPARLINPQNSEMQFREIFDLAVQSRLRSILPIACLLSGGLDSSSIACSAANTISKSDQSPVKTVSAVFDLTPDLSERPFIESVLKHHNFEPHFVAFDDYAPFQNFQEILRPH
jgi:asparagine synthase (glutamine-hydrolysing)